MKLIRKSHFLEKSIFIGFRLTNGVSSKTEPRFWFARLDYLIPLGFEAKIYVPTLIQKCCFLIGWADIQTFSVCKTLSFRKGNFSDTYFFPSKIFLSFFLKIFTGWIVDTMLVRSVSIRENNFGSISQSRAKIGFGVGGGALKTPHWASSAEERERERKSMMKRMTRREGTDTSAYKGWGVR